MSLFTPRTIEIKARRVWAWGCLGLSIPPLMLFALVLFFFRGDGGVWVSGKVIDQSGAPVEGAVATLHPPVESDIDLGTGGEMRSFDDGVFFLGSTFRPQHASFTLTVEKPGCESVSMGPYEAPKTYDGIIVTLKSAVAQP